MTIHKPEFFNKTFQNQEEFICFLNKENNAYSRFILKRYFKQPLNKKDYQKHHIQPKHANGEDHPWNLLWLSVKQHAIAHLLLFRCYGNYFDYCAYCMMRNRQIAAHKALRTAIYLRMKEQQKGFWNSEFQRELGKRSKERKPYARNSYVLAALEKGFILENNLTKETVVIKPRECSSLQDVLSLWLNRPDMSKYYLEWINAEKKHNYHLYTSLSRSLTGHRDNQTNKSVYSVAGWRILGLFL